MIQSLMMSMFLALGCTWHQYEFSFGLLISILINKDILSILYIKLIHLPSCPLWAWGKFQEPTNHTVGLLGVFEYRFS